MAIQKVRVGKEYTYNPVPLDQFDGRTGLKKGDIVKVVNLRGCPPANTMGHCYVERVSEKGKFVGMVCTNSLIPYVSNKVLNEVLVDMVNFMRKNP